MVGCRSWHIRIAWWQCFRGATWYLAGRDRASFDLTVQFAIPHIRLTGHPGWNLLRTDFTDFVPDAESLVRPSSIIISGDAACAHSEAIRTVPTVRNRRGPPAFADGPSLHLHWNLRVVYETHRDSHTWIALRGINLDHILPVWRGCGRR